MNRLKASVFIYYKLISNLAAGRVLREVMTPIMSYWCVYGRLDSCLALITLLFALSLSACIYVVGCHSTAGHRTIVQFC